MFFVPTEYVQKKLSSVWPGWRITNELGKGSYGYVYEIIKDNAGRAGMADTALTCALKVLYIEDTEQDSGQTRDYIYSYNNQYKQGSSRGGYPQRNASQGGYSGNAYPQGSIRQSGYTAGAYPQGNVRQGSYSEGGYPQGNALQRGYTGSSYPQGNVRQGGYAGDRNLQFSAQNDGSRGQGYPQGSRSQSGYFGNDNLNSDFSQTNRMFSGSRMDDFINNVSSEINMMIQMKGHPHIVSIEDYAVLKQGNSCLILIRMEKLESLKHYLEERGPMNREDVIRLGSDICKALEYCESKKVIHRDIKPGNLFYSEKTGFKLGDFGISRRIESISMQSSMTTIGTPNYMAPEIYHGEKYNNTADLYSLGIVLYQKLNNDRMPLAPQDGELSNDITRNIFIRRMRGETFPAPAAADSRLGNVILKACAFDPQQRFKTAAEFRAALKNGIEDEPPAPPGSKKPLIAGAIAAAGIIVVFFLLKILPGILHPSTNYTVLLVDESDRVIEKHSDEGHRGDMVDYPAPDLDGYDLNDDASKSIILSGNSEENQLVFHYVKETTTSTVTEAPTTTTSEAPTTTTTQKQPEYVRWTDSNLKEAVMAYLGYSGDIKVTDAAAVKEIVVRASDIEDISSLKYFTGLESLDLAQNKIKDLSVVSGMKRLNTLHAEENMIEDLTPLQNLTTLHRLDLDKNLVTDISALRKLTQLEMLDIRSNQVEDISCLRNMTGMKSLYISENRRIRDITAIRGMTKLDYLSMGHNRIEDITPIKGMKDLTVLVMDYNNIEDFSVMWDLLKLGKIYHLKVAGNPGTNKLSLSDFPEKLDLDIRKK